MLGKYVDTTIYGIVSENGIYTGYINTKTKDNQRQRETVYLISHSKVDDTVKSVVIATAMYSDENQGGHRLIVAPIGDIFYEPEIIERLSHIRNFSYKKIICLYEKSCGAIVFHRDAYSGIPKVLLVKNHNGKYWSFPKGHVEKGETEHQTAVREIKEETGLDVTLYKNYRQISNYVPFGKIKKRVVFFLAESETDNVHIQHDEIDSYTWVTFSQAQKMCKYENDLRILQTAQQKIKEYDKNG